MACIRTDPGPKCMNQRLLVCTSRSQTSCSDRLWAGRGCRFLAWLGSLKRGSTSCSRSSRGRRTHSRCLLEAADYGTVEAVRAQGRTPCLLPGPMSSRQPRNRQACRSNGRSPYLADSCNSMNQNCQQLGESVFGFVSAAQRSTLPAHARRRSTGERRTNSTQPLACCLFDA